MIVKETLMNSTETNFEQAMNYFCFFGISRSPYERKETRSLAVAPDLVAGDYGNFHNLHDLIASDKESIITQIQSNNYETVFTT